MKRSNEPSLDEPASKKANVEALNRIRMLERLPFSFYWSDRVLAAKNNINTLLSRDDLTMDVKLQRADEYANSFIDEILEWVDINTGERFARGPAYQDLKAKLLTVDGDPVGKSDFVEAIYNSMLGVKDENGIHYSEGANDVRADTYLVDRGFSWGADVDLYRANSIYVSPDFRKRVDKAAEKMRYVIPAMQTRVNPNQVPISNLYQPLTREQAIKHGTMFDEEDNESTREAALNDLALMDNE